MSTSWHDFFFAAVDPKGTITLDKLPGALWLQALSVRAFGVHQWAMVLPQVVEGVATVLVLYRAVRLLAGPIAGLIAAGLLVVTPACVGLDRGNVSDSLLILLLVAAASAIAGGLERGRWRSLLFAGALVGLAFQAKMLQAWLVLVPLAGVWLLAASGARKRRLAQLGVCGAVTAVVSLAWISIVSLVPASQRPSVDGSLHNSWFEQVFIYNGFGREVGTPTGSLGRLPAFIVAEDKNALNAVTLHVRPSWHRLLVGPIGREAGWLIPAALIAGLFVIVRRRRAERGDLVRAGAVFWLLWLVVHIVVFSFAGYINGYYPAVLAPAIGAVIGMGVVEVRRMGLGAVPTRAALGAVVLGSAAYGAWLIPPEWWAADTAWAGIGVVALLATVWLFLSAGSSRLSTVAAVLAVPLAVIALAVAPAVTSASVVVSGQGPFDTPLEPIARTHVIEQDENLRVAAAAQYLKALNVAQPAGTPYVAAVETSSTAAVYILATGEEFLPIGGVIGLVPSPSLARLEHLVATGQLHFFVIPVKPPDLDPRLRWVQTHCASRPVPPNTQTVLFWIYRCDPSSVTVAGAGAGAGARSGARSRSLFSGPG
jgi:4-amino-4-deoxy-L-arabinose transferase-like glycosyltransferase